MPKTLNCGMGAHAKCVRVFRMTGAPCECDCHAGPEVSTQALDVYVEKSNSASNDSATYRLIVNGQVVAAVIDDRPITPGDPILVVYGPDGDVLECDGTALWHLERECGVEL